MMAKLIGSRAKQRRLELNLTQPYVAEKTEAMRAHSLAITPYAMLSRALCMQRGRHLVINLPGSEKAARENWDGVVKALPHAAKMMAGGGH